MVTDYGMGTTISSRRLPVDDYSVSEASRRIVDEEQQELTDLAWRRARKMIEEHRSELDALANALLENEVLEREDIDRIMAEHGHERRTVTPLASREARIAATDPS
jgi:ATP-dependent Zn protease